jgi:hypothetical protein
MKAILCLPLLFSSGLFAGEAQDRAAIDQVIEALNDPAQRHRLFTSDADSAVDFDHLIALHHIPCAPILIGMDEVWIQLTQPRVASGNIRFITSDVATVDGASTIQGAITLAPRVPLLFVMRRGAGEWKIGAVRVLRRAPR